MRLLRLTTSNDTWGEVAAEFRAPAACERTIFELTGELEGKVIAEAWLAARAR